MWALEISNNRERTSDSINTNLPIFAASSHLASIHVGKLTHSEHILTLILEKFSCL